MIASTLTLVIIASAASIISAQQQPQDVSGLCGPCGGRIGAEIGCEEGLTCERPDTLGGASGVCVQAATKGSIACANGTAVTAGDGGESVATDSAAAAETTSTQAVAGTTTTAGSAVSSAAAVSSAVSKPAAASSSTTTSVKSAATSGFVGVAMAAFAAVFFV
ncbi:hypothetical protein HDU81_000335 [Chytriomyces hyalinus]|nr:hypothetical protein HDU81_000335 [Chytriomyces hyalinus]